MIHKAKDLLPDLDHGHLPEMFVCRICRGFSTVTGGFYVTSPKQRKTELCYACERMLKAV